MTTAQAAPSPALVPFFLTETWAHAWARTLGADAELVETAPGDGRVSLAGRRREGFRTLRLAGGEHADYEEPPLGAPVTELLAGGRWDALIAGHVPAGSRVLAGARELAAEGHPVRIREFGSTLVAPLAETWDEQAARLRKKLLADARRCERRLGEQLGEVRVERVTDPAGAEETVEEIAASQRRRFAELGRPSMFEDPATVGFYRALARASHADPGFHLTRLVAGERIAAAHLGFVAPDRFLYHTPVFDPDLGRFSPSRLLMLRLIREAIELGLPRFDLGRGEEPYKLELGAEQQPLLSVAIGARGLRGRAAVGWFGRVRPALARRFAASAPALRRVGVLREYS